MNNEFIELRIKFTSLIYESENQKSIELVTLEH